MSRKREPTIRLRRMGIELKQIRHSLGLGIEAAATLTTRSGGAVSKWENGYSRFFPRDLDQILNCYGVHDQDKRKRLHKLNLEGRKKGWWLEYRGILLPHVSDYISLEAEAKRIRSFELDLIHGLMQTEEYARAVIWSAPMPRPDEVLESFLALRMNRQRVLTKADPPQFHSILGEAALRQHMGGIQTMRDQLELLADIAELPNITIQVLPFTVEAHPATFGSFHMLDVEPSLVVAVHDHPFGSINTDEPRHIERATVCFERLSSIALSPEDSRTLIERVAAEL